MDSKQCTTQALLKPLSTLLSNISTFIFCFKICDCYCNVKLLGNRAKKNFVIYQLLSTGRIAIPWIWLAGDMIVAKGR